MNRRAVWATWQASSSKPRVRNRNDPRVHHVCARMNGCKHMWTVTCNPRKAHPAPWCLLALRSYCMSAGCTINKCWHSHSTAREGKMRGCERKGDPRGEERGEGRQGRGGEGKGGEEGGVRGGGRGGGERDRGQESITSVFPPVSPPLFCQKSLSLRLGLAN